MHSDLSDFTQSNPYADGPTDADNTENFQLYCLNINSGASSFAFLRDVPLQDFCPLAIRCSFGGEPEQTGNFHFKTVADYLVDHGFQVLVSEWYPSENFAGKNSWRALKAYPCELEEAHAWGSVIGFRAELEREAIVQGVLESCSGLSTRPPVVARHPIAGHCDPPLSDRIYLLADGNDCYKEIFDGLFLPGTEIKAEVSFCCSGEHDLSFSLGKHGTGPAESSSVRSKTYSGQNVVRIDHIAKSFQHRLALSVENRSSGAVILEGVRVSLEGCQGEHRWAVDTFHRQARAINSAEQDAAM